MSLDKGSIFDDLTLWTFISRCNVPLMVVHDPLTSSHKGKAVIRSLGDGDKDKPGVAAVAAYGLTREYSSSSAIIADPCWSNLRQTLQSATPYRFEFLMAVLLVCYCKNNPTFGESFCVSDPLRAKTASLSAPFLGPSHVLSVDFTKDICIAISRLTTLREEIEGSANKSKRINPKAIRMTTKRL